MKHTFKYAISAYALTLPLQSGISMSRERMPSPAVKSEPIITYPFKIEALCSLYSKYEVCHPKVTSTSISANFPTEYLSLSSSDIVSIDIYDARRREMNYVLGTASTIIFGPYGLIGFLATRKVGDVDFGIRYRENNRIRTAFIRFKNNNSLTSFGKAIEPLVKSVADIQSASRP